MLFERRFHNFYHRVRKEDCPEEDPVHVSNLPPKQQVELVEAMGWTISVGHLGYCNYGLGSGLSRSKTCSCNPTPHYHFTPPPEVRVFLHTEGRHS